MQIFDLRHVPDEIFSGGEFFVANFAARLLVFGRPVSFDAEKILPELENIKQTIIKKKVSVLYLRVLE
jgi:hypothetical protein